jgi:hypothetical protein
MSHFNLKSLIFYGVAISSVVILFKGVTAYGESNIKAPTLISGRYRLAATNLPGCLKAKSLILDIQQSGIYLNSSLFPGDNPAISQEMATKKPSLIGQISRQQLVLSGSIPQIESCRNQSINIQGVLEKENLQGQITLKSSPKPISFIAKKEASTEPKKSQNH